jgi:hypothetical protein
LPSQVSFQGNLQLNPLGNISGFNDFIYTENPIELDYEIRIPLRFSSESILLTDTLDIQADIDEDFFGALEVLVTNEYPFSLGIDLILVNSITNEEYIVVSNQEVRPGIQQPNSSSVIPVGSLLSFPVNEVIYSKLKSDHRMIIRGRISTPNYPGPVGLYNFYKLTYAAILRGEYGVVVQ